MIHRLSLDKVTTKALAMKSFSLDGLVLLTDCRDSFFLLHVQMWFFEGMHERLNDFEIQSDLTMTMDFNCH